MRGLFGESAGTFGLFGGEWRHEKLFFSSSAVMRGLFGGRVPEPSGSLGGEWRNLRALLWYTRSHFGKEAAHLPSFVVYSSSLWERGCPPALFCGIPLATLAWRPHLGESGVTKKLFLTLAPSCEGSLGGEWRHERALFSQDGVTRGSLLFKSRDETALFSSDDVTRGLFYGRVPSREGFLGGECRHARALWRESAVMRGLFGGRMAEPSGSWGESGVTKKLFSRQVPLCEGSLGGECLNQRALWGRVASRKTFFSSSAVHARALWGESAGNLRALWGESGVTRGLFGGRVA